MSELFQDKQYEINLCKVGFKHLIQTAYMRLETLENLTEQNKESYETGYIPRWVAFIITYFKDKYARYVHNRWV